MKGRKSDKMKMTGDDYLSQDYVAFPVPPPDSLTLTVDITSNGATNPTTNNSTASTSNNQTIQVNCNGVISVTPYINQQDPDTRQYIQNILCSIIEPEGSESYLPWSILNAVCCGVVLGLLAVLFSVKSQRAKEQGFRDYAHRYSLWAYRINIVASLIGFCSLLTLFIIYCATDLLDNVKGLKTPTYMPPRYRNQG